MKREFTAAIEQEGEWFVAQCLEVDVASQGRTEEEALHNLTEALALYFEEPRGKQPKVVKFEAEVHAA